MGWSKEKRLAAAARMKALNADPEFKAATSARMKALHADPEFKAANAKRSSARMKALHADPEFKAATSARMTDPWLASISTGEKKLYRKMCAAGVPWRSARRQIDKDRILRKVAP